MQSEAPESDPHTCNLLHMKTQPYFGVYSDNYEWALPIGKFEPKDLKSIYKNLPLYVRQDMKAFSELTGRDVFRFLVLNLSLQELHTDAFANKHLCTIRLNTVLHPILFRKAHAGEEHKTKILVTVYPIAGGVTSLYQYGSVAVNPKDGILKTEELEVHLHPTEDGGTAISPNNAAFLISAVDPINSFFLVAVYKLGSRMEMLITQQVVDECRVNMINSPRLDLIKNVDLVLNHQKLMLSTPSRGQIDAADKEFRVASTYAKMLPIVMREVRNRLKNTFAYYCEIIANKGLENEGIILQLKALFRELFTNEVVEDFTSKNSRLSLQQGELNSLVAAHWLGSFYKMIWRIYLKPEVENFGELLFLSASKVFKLELIRKFLIFIISDYRHFTNYQLAMIQELVKPEYQLDQEDPPPLELSLPNKEQHKIGLAQSVPQLPPEMSQEEGQESGSMMASLPKPREEVKIEAPAIMINSGQESEAQVRRDVENKFLDDGVYKLPGNPDQVAFEMLLEGAMEGNISKLIDGVEMMNPALQAHMFNRIWQIRGRVHGVHHDLGRCAFFCSPEVPSCYHMGGESRIEFLLNYQDILAAVDKKYVSFPE